MGDFESQSIRPGGYICYYHFISSVNSEDWIAGNSLCIGRVVLLESFEDSNLDLASIPILLNRPDDLDGDFASRLYMPRFDDLAECSLSKQADDLV